MTSMDVIRSNLRKPDKSCAVYLPNDMCRLFQYWDVTDIQTLVSTLIHDLGTTSSYWMYSLRWEHLVSNERQWVPWATYSDSVDQLLKMVEPLSAWRLCLLVRFYPKSYKELYRNDRTTFLFIFDQVKREYMRMVVENVDQEHAFQIAALEIRRLFGSMPITALEKLSNMEFIEKEIGFRNLFPAVFLEKVKTKDIKKGLMKYFKYFGQLNEEQCCQNFFDIVRKYRMFDTELYQCTIGTSWGIPVDIVVGCSCGVSYRSDPKSINLMVNFDSIESIRIIEAAEGSSGKTSMALFVKGTEEPLVLTFQCSRKAREMADIVDHYCMVINNWSESRVQFIIGDSVRGPSQPAYSRSAAPKPGLKSSLSSVRVSSDSLDYAEIPVDRLPFSSSDHDITHEAITVDVLVGRGQFGEVYKGTYTKPTKEKVDVAIKTLIDNDPAENRERLVDSFLEEAYIMRQFNHPNIIQLIGVCTEEPMYIVMELAALGQIRSYLQDNVLSIHSDTLLLYCKQLCQALSYLELKNFVHRDIAARNVLVSTPQLIKLADFGLSRTLEGMNYYKASKGKLPIKWMAPESINFQRFTTASDVWMFGVCLWEILTYGEKPFLGISNSDVIGRIENGERLNMPAKCPPTLYRLMNECWSYAPNQRPTFHSMEETLRVIHEEEKALWEENRRREQRRISSMQFNDESAPPKPSRPLTVRFHDIPEIASTMPMVKGKMYDPAPPPKPPGVKTNRLSIPSSLIFQPPVQDVPPVPVSSESMGFGEELVFLADLTQEVDRMVLRDSLAQQKKQSDADSAWLRAEESNLAYKSGAVNEPAVHVEQTQTVQDITHKLSSSEQAPHTADKGTGGEDQSVVPLQVKTVVATPPSDTTEVLAEDQDDPCIHNMYDCVIQLVSGISKHKESIYVVPHEELVEIIKGFGTSLRDLFQAVDSCSPLLGEDALKEVEMLQATCNQDLAEVLMCMRNVQKYAHTMVDSEYRRNLLTACHLLAVDARNLCDAVAGRDPVSSSS